MQKLFFKYRITLTAVILSVVMASSINWSAAQDTINTVPGDYGVTIGNTAAADWSGEWVTVKEVAENVTPNLWLAYRKTFDVDNVPKTAPVRIACDSKYWLWVNGKMIVFEGSIKRGPTRTDSYFDCVDIAAELNPGKNTICILQWYFGKEGFAHKNSGKPGLLVDGKIGNAKLMSDATWRGVWYKAFEQQTADPQPNYRLAESNIRFNAQNDFAGNWMKADFDDAVWDKVVTLGKPPVSPWGKLFPRPIPFLKDYGLKNYVNANDIPKISDGKPIVCKLPYNSQVTPYLKIDASAGTEIDIRTDNYHGGSEYNVRCEYVARDGKQEFEFFGWFNGDHVIYTIPAGVKIESLQYRETGYNTEFAGSFECDDAFYNTLWEKSVRTLYITMRDNYMDCPDRERAQWWGDEVNELGEAFYALDAKSEQLARKGIYELMQWQRENGVISSPCPAGNYNTELPLQMLASVGHYGVYTWCFYADDKQPVIDTYPAIKRYIDLWQIGEDGVTIVRNGDWSWGDWGENIDLKPLTSCWHKLALKAQLEYMQWAGAMEDREAVLAKIKSLDENFNRVFWTGSEYRDPEYKGKTDDRTNAMAVIAGFAKPEQYEALRKVLQEQKHASPYMEKYILESLFQMSFADDAMARMKERFTKMVEHPDYTTLWEGWGIGAEGFGGGTINHAWSGGGLTCLAQYTIGLEPTQPGFKEFVVKPQPGPLTKAKLVTPTKYGDIVVEMDGNERGLGAYQILVPEGTTAKFVPPSPWRTEKERPTNTFLVMQAYKWEDGKYVEVNKLKELGPGQWKFNLGIMHIDR